MTSVNLPALRKAVGAKKAKPRPRNFSAPLCSDCAFKLHVAWTCGYCTRRLWLDKDGIPRHPRCTDERTERCGLKEPRFFQPKVAP